MDQEGGSQLPPGKTYADVYRCLPRRVVGLLLSGGWHTCGSGCTPHHTNVYRLRGLDTTVRCRCVARCRDVRGAVDLCHRDGSIKREVAANPEK